MTSRTNIEHRTSNAERRTACAAQPFGFRISSRPAERGSVLVLVLLIAFGLVSLTIYFANAMTMELRASDNRASALSADQAIEGAARYVGLILATYATNGALPAYGLYQAEAVPVGNSRVPAENAHFWLIGRDASGASSSEPFFSLVEENSKLDLNAFWLTADALATNLPRMTYEFADGIIDWRDTNGTSSTLSYGQMGYEAKHAPFETVDELRLVYGATMEALLGPDVNRNGVLDASEQSGPVGGQSDPGVLEWVTVYSLEPNVHDDGTALTNVNTRADLQALLQNRLGTSRAADIIARVFPDSGQGQQQGGATTSYTNLLQFYLDSGMTADEFGAVYRDLTVTNGPVTSRVNINTASAAVLACLPGMDSQSAAQAVSYRETAGANLNSIAWIVDALGSTSTAIRTLARGDYITTRSYQFTADISAMGPYGRGYRRVKFVFDTSEGTPKIIYRQDLSRLGWALGQKTRETWVTQNTR